MASALKGDVPFDAGMIALYRNNLEMAVKKALDQSGKSLDLQVKVISPDGRITA